MDVEIISKECIKPSSPTPHYLKNYQLSFMDLHSGHGHIPLVLYYSMNQDKKLSSSDIPNVVAQRLQVLKQSLSKALSRYYPLAGTIKDSYSIDCNDTGAYFVEAKVKMSLNEFLNHPNLLLITKFFPDGAKWKPTPGNYVTGIQVTAFSCGGFAIAAYISHMVLDGTAFSSFLKGWAATAEKNVDKIMCPRFDGTSIFPPTDEYTRADFYLPMATVPMKPGRYVTRRFYFDASAISKLKAKAASSSVQNPTRVESLTALFGKCFKAIMKENYDSADKTFLLGHAVNLRRRARPQFSDYCIANFAWLASFLCKEEETTELKDFVRKINEAIGTWNEDFMNSLQGDRGMLNYLEAIKRDREIHYSKPVVMLIFSSWCNFGFYDVDFGFGRPAWVSILDLAQLSENCNAIVFVDDKNRKGIEAWVSLLQEDMAVLERDKELLAFATMDSSALKQG